MVIEKHEKHDFMPLGSHLRLLSIWNVSIRGVLQKIILEVLCLVDLNAERLVIRLEAAVKI